MDHIADLRDEHGLLAYAQVGDGPPLLLMQDLFMPLDSLDEDALGARLLEDMGSFATVVVFDRRGIGFSDPITDSSRSIVDVWAEDVARVIEGVAGRPATVFGMGLMSGRTALRIAQLRPDLVEHLLLMNVGMGGRDSGAPTADMVLANVDGESDFDFIDMVAPSRAHDPAVRRQRERAGRRGANAADARRMWSAFMAEPPLEGLEAISVPTTMLLRPDLALRSRVSSALAVVGAIPGAELVELSGADVYPFDGDVDEVVQAVADVLDVSAKGSQSSAFVALLFTDIVDSTQMARQVGDVQWRGLIDVHDSATTRLVGRHGGTVVKQTGDGVLATFEMPSRALRAANALRAELADLNLPVRIGVHAAEIERRGDDISGVGVNLAARVMGTARGNEVLVSAALPLIVAGSEFTFSPRGPHQLKGIDTPQELFALDPPAPT